MNKIVIQNEKKLVDFVKRKVEVIASHEPVVGSYLWAYLSETPNVCLEVVLDRPREEVRHLKRLHEVDFIKDEQLYFETTLTSVDSLKKQNPSDLLAQQNLEELHNAVILTDKDDFLKTTQESLQKERPNFRMSNQATFSKQFVKKIGNK